MNELLASLRTQETWGFIFKFIFCTMFYFGINDQLGIQMGVAPFIVLGSLAVYWKFVRRRFI